MSWLNWLTAKKDSKELKDLTEQVRSAKTIVELTWNIGKAVVQAGYEKHQADRACAEYLDKYEQRHGLVKILGMSNPVELASIYTEVRVVAPNRLHGYRTLDELHESYLQKERSLASYDHDSVEPRSGLAVANDELHGFLNVLGAPGAGKSTFLRYIGLIALQNYRQSTTIQLLSDPSTLRYQFNLLPVLLELRGLRTKSISFVDLIDEELHTNGFPPKFGHAALQAGGLLVLLDGLDEVPSEKLDEAITAIRDLVDRHPKCRYVTSCRTAFYKDYFSRFSDVLLTDFSDEQIRNMIRNWFRSDRDQELDTAATLWELLEDTRHQATRELARTPLLATFLCLVYDDRQTLPTNRAELYGDALRILLERWAASKRVHGEPVFTGLSTKRELLMLEEFAGPAYQRQQFFFSSQELAKTFEKYLKNDAIGHEMVDGRSVLEEIERRQGLLVQRAHDKYSFSHLTLHEYLAACHYYKCGRSREIIADTLTKESWREIHLLLAGLQEPDADQFLLAMANDTAKLLNTFELRELISWARNAVPGGMSSQHTAARRIILAWFGQTLSLARVIDRAVTLGRDAGVDCRLKLDDSVDLAFALDRSFKPAIGDSLTPTLARLLVRLRARLYARDLVRPDFNSDCDRDLLYNQVRSNSQALGVFFEQQNVLRKDLSEAFEVASETYERKPLRDGQVEQNGNSNFRFLHEEAQAALGIPAKARNLSVSDFSQFRLYMLCIQRIVECREAAERVTQLGWNNVCDRLLAVPT